MPYATVPAALDAVRRAECGAAMIPMENSRKGVVPATLEGLTAGEDLHIVAEVVVPVTFALLAAPVVGLDGIERVLSHPHALAQCAGWLRRNLPGARLEPAHSTAGAARDVVVADDPSCAAIAAPAVADQYGMRVLAQDIGDDENAVTRFVMVRKAGVPPARTGRDRTSLLISVGDRTPAVRPDILSAFSAGRVNLTWVQAWPTGMRLGTYRFFVDVDGHIDDQPVSRAMAALFDIGAETGFLGSYPRSLAAERAQRPGRVSSPHHPTPTTVSKDMP